MNFFIAVFFKGFDQIAGYCFSQILTAQLSLVYDKSFTEYRNCNFATSFTGIIQGFIYILGTQVTLPMSVSEEEISLSKIKFVNKKF